MLGSLASHAPLKSKLTICIDGDEFDTVTSFCYLGDVLGQAGGCADVVTARIRSAWKAFHKLLPILSNCAVLYVNRGNVFTI